MERHTLRNLVVVAITAAVISCGEPEPIPPEIERFVQAHPELGLDIQDVEQAPDWAEGRRWRVTRERGETLLFYEKGGEIVSVRRTDLSDVWREE